MKEMEGLEFIGPIRVEIRKVYEEEKMEVEIVNHALKILSDSLGQEPIPLSLPRDSKAEGTKKTEGKHLLRDDLRVKDDDIRPVVLGFVEEVVGIRSPLLEQKTPMREECIVIYRADDFHGTLLSYSCHHGKSGADD